MLLLLIICCRLIIRTQSERHFPYQHIFLGKEQAVDAGMDEPQRHKILLLDDDQDLLEVYRELLGRLPRKPEIHTTTSGARALALLESDHFNLLLCDLKMPKMDGLQVLSIVRRKFPGLRTAVLTCIVDEQFRTRAYAMGVDLFLEKPNSSKEITFLLDCIESLLDQEASDGFRGVQSKSLVDLIQLECLSQSSSILRIINGVLEGRIWIQEGEIIDAATDELTGVEAFQRILGWRTGNFEILPEDPSRGRTIFTSYQGLLLESAQALDEAEDAVAQTASGSKPRSALGELARHPGVDFILTVNANNQAQSEAWGLDAADQIAAWTHSTMKNFRALGEMLQAGMLNRVDGRGPMQNLSISGRGDIDMCVGFHRSLPSDTVRETMKKIVAKCAS
jgi:CheY-like chemotaxis protein